MFPVGIIHDSNIHSLKVIEVIRVVSLIGEGIEGDPAREITEYFGMDGTLIVRRDPWLENKATEGQKP